MCRTAALRSRRTTTAREAEVTARRLAVAIGARLIYLHDAHHRVRSAPVRPM
jgi:hypothetical protein